MHHVHVALLLAQSSDLPAARRAGDDKRRSDRTKRSFISVEISSHLRRPLGVRRHISTSGRGGVDDVIVTWPVVCR